MCSRVHRRRRKPHPELLIMDPDCAICHAPADRDCHCEAKGLETAIKLAEQRIMHSMYMEIRTWVRKHAQDYVLSYFAHLSEKRKIHHRQQIDDMTAYTYHTFRAPPHPTDIQALEAQLKLGIDSDWQRSVSRYPEVLEYFFGLVEVTLPSEEDPAVKELPMNTLPLVRKVGRRSRSQAPATIASGSAHNGGRDSMPRIARGRTPPIGLVEARRTPGPPSDPRFLRQPPPGPGSSYGAHFSYEN